MNNVNDLKDNTGFE